MGILRDIVGSVPVIGQTVGFVEVATVVTKISSPSAAAAAGIELAIERCTPPIVKYPLKCAVLFGQFIIVGGSITNPVTAPFSVSMLIGSLKSILLEEIK